MKSVKIVYKKHEFFVQIKMLPFILLNLWFEFLFHS